ncbi:unnamed protein product [Calypogeia fissa]
MAKTVVGRLFTTAKRPLTSWSFSLRHVHTERGLGEAVRKGSKVNEEASLPLIQRCKNLLATNWRGQLSSVIPEKEKVHGSLAQYALVSGQVVLWLPNTSPHASNLLMDSRGSLVVGHTDPRPLIHALREVGHVPPRVIVLGLFDPIPASETEHIRKRVIKLVSSTKQAVESAGPCTHSILKEAGSAVDARFKALDAMIHSSMDEFSMYSLNPRTCQYVDLVGGRHEVEVTDLAAATVDHLCPVLAGLIEGINRNDTRRLALIMFCAVYMHVRAEDAYIFAADRWGINLLAKVDESKAGDVDTKQDEPSSQSPAEKKWREFRFAFSHEVRNTEQFCTLLVEMERESLETLTKAKELQAGLEGSLT